MIVLVRVPIKSFYLTFVIIMSLVTSSLAAATGPLVNSTFSITNFLLWAGILLLVAFVWILQLLLTVRRRTADLQREIDLRTEKDVELMMSMEHLERTHKRLRLNIDRMPLAYIVWDDEFAVDEWNHAATEMFGWSAEEARGKHAYELVVPEESRDVVEQVWMKLMSGDDSSNSVNANITKEGRQLICSWYNTPLRSSDGKVYGALSMVEDITERYREEETRNQQFELISKIFDSINALVYVADLNTFELLYLNQYGQEVFGEDWSGKKCFEYLQTDQKEMCSFCTNDRLILNGEPAPAYIWEFQNTSNQRWYQCVDRAIPWFNGQYVRMEIAFDITEMKLAEQLKEEMVSAVSHEMRTPLTAVMGYVEFLMMNKIDSDEIQKHMRTIYAEAAQLNDLIDSFLNLQQLKAGQQPLSFFEIDTCELLNSIRESVTYDHARHKLVVDCPKNIVRIKGDTVQVREAVNRVVNNAIKYSPAGGQVTMRARESGGMVEISIKDHGVGIPAGALEKIFDRFFRVDNTDTREFGGVGIGLSLVHDIVTTHGGRVWAESEEKEGTTITLTFPVFD